ncbi:MAG: N-formylglutamate amidohydrolase, partial [Schleiferilactobacillus harbinensis]
MDLITIQNQHTHRYPVVISLPHSGTWLPDDMRQALLPGVILANTDWFLPALYDFLPAAGFTTLT